VELAQSLQQNCMVRVQGRLALEPYSDIRTGYPKVGLNVTVLECEVLQP
jgi:hypothetical protein